MAELAERKKDIEKLETEHKRQFVALIQAAKLRMSLARKFGLDSKEFKDYNKIYVPFVVKWYLRQTKFEKAGGAQKFNWKYPDTSKTGVPGDFFYSQGIAALEKIALEWDKERKGTGFIPLLIWAVIAIVAAFTAVEVTDELNNTAAEQKGLVDSTSKFCTDHNLTPEECQKLLTQQTEASSGGGGLGIMGYILLFAGIAFGGPILVDAFKSKKTT